MGRTGSGRSSRRVASKPTVWVCNACEREGKTSKEHLIHIAIGRASRNAIGMQGHNDPNRELLDAAALCRGLVPEGSVEAFLADHRQDSPTPGEMGWTVSKR